jgi:predicted nuclease of predicted toxin-antitoxin system
VYARLVEGEGVDSAPPAPFRYYLDEHVPTVMAEQLRARGIDALAATEAGRAARAITDEEQLAFAAANGRTFVTSDRDFIGLSARCTPHAGVLLLQNRMSIRQAVAFLELFAGVTTPEEMRDRLRFCDW